jgi:hypothetical protein
LYDKHKNRIPEEHRKPSTIWFPCIFGPEIRTLRTYLYMWLLYRTLFPFPPSFSSLGQRLNLLNMSSRSRPIRRARPAYEVAKVQAKAIPQELIDTAFQPAAIGKQYSAQLLATHTNIDLFQSETMTEYSCHQISSHLLWVAKSSPSQTNGSLQPRIFSRRKPPSSNQTNKYSQVSGWMAGKVADTIVPRLTTQSLSSELLQASSRALRLTPRSSEGTKHQKYPSKDVSVPMIPKLSPGEAAVGDGRRS